MPVVSVIIPTYNRRQFLARSISSVLDQTYRDLELIIADDASNDGTREFVLGLSDRRVRYLPLPANRGSCAAKNAAVKIAKAQYIAFLDSDDAWHPTKLERQLQVIASDPDVDVVFTGWQWVDQETGKVLRRRMPDENGLIEGLPRWAYNIAVDFLVRREVIRGNPYDELFRSYTEFDLLFRLAKFRASFVPEVLVSCYEHAGARTSATDPAVRVEFLEELLTRHQTLLRSNPRVRSRLHMMAAAYHLREIGDPSSAKRHLWKVLQSSPGSWKAWAYVLACFVPRRLSSS